MFVRMIIFELIPKKSKTLYVLWSSLKGVCKNNKVRVCVADIEFNMYLWSYPEMTLKILHYNFIT